MYYTIGNGNLYRVTSATTVWPNPVRGHGAYFISNQGNRYNRTDQLTVYCSEDPVVSITEGAFYQAIEWHRKMAYSRINAITYPLRSEHTLWAFQIDPPPPVVDLESAAAMARFVYQPHVLLNPSREYTRTQELADDVRAHIPPPGSPDPRPEGVKAPSIGTPRKGPFQPHQLSLFVREMNGIVPYDQRSILIGKCRIEFEFLAAAPVAGSANYHSIVIDWKRPRFRIAPIPGAPSVSPIPAFPTRPGSKVIHLNRWYRSISIWY